MSEDYEKKKSNMISLNALNKLSKSICKIIYRKGNKEWAGTGFFMNIKYENQVLINFLLTNYKTLNPNRFYTSIQLQIGDIKKDFIIKKKRYKKYYQEGIDIAMIEILKDDEIIENVDFLSYDLNYLKYGYDYYLNKEIIILQHPYGEEIHSTIGKIKSINNFEFNHDAGTCRGCDGSPVILIENNCVIGIHKGIKENNEKNKIGTFIGKLFEEIFNDSKLQRRIGKLKNQINFETNKIENEETPNVPNNSESLSQKNDNEEIYDKKNLELERENADKNTLILKYKIQNKPYVNLFSKKFVNSSGKKFVIFINNEQRELCCQIDISKMNIINNILEVKLKKIDKVESFQCMFKNTDLIFISGFSSFDPEELTNISSMFSDCENLSSIIDIDFLNTSNVKKMNKMFLNCKSLESLPDISIRIIT